MTNIREIVEKRIALEILPKYGSVGPLEGGDGDKDYIFLSFERKRCRATIHLRELIDSDGLRELIAQAESLGIPEAQRDYIEAEYRKELDLRRKAFALNMSVKWEWHYLSFNQCVHNLRYALGENAENYKLDLAEARERGLIEDGEVAK